VASLRPTSHTCHGKTGYLFDPALIDDCEIVYEDGREARKTLPSGHTRGLAFIVPEDWRPEQALAVTELLDDLREAI
jgi:hypothetical protein